MASLINPLSDDACVAGDADFEQCVVDTIRSMTLSMNTFWLLFGAVLVFFMQTGFAMLEVGCVQLKNTKNILVKNVFDASIGGIMWYITGYGIAMGKDNYPATGDNGFIGTNGFVLTDGFRGAGEETGYQWATWLFQWAFAATTATIVSGSVVERCTFWAYCVYATSLIGFIYPVVVHWGWSSGGWASAWRSEGRLLVQCGVLDFAGSGVVHMTGGAAALVGAILLGPRVGRFVDGQPVDLPQLSFVYQTLGTLCLWFGWYGFNGVSSLYIVGPASLVGARAMVNTTIAGGVGCVSSSVIAKMRKGYIDPESANNGILGGLVAITAGCAVVNPEGAVVIGLIAGIVYNVSSSILLMLQIDDVVDASPVHYFCGAWGVIAAGFFATESNYREAYYADRADKCCGVFYGCGGRQLGANIIFVLAVTAWAGIMATLVFLFAKFTFGLRVSKEVEEIGMDSSKHGGMMSYQVTNDEQMSGSRSGIPANLFPAGSAQVGGAPVDTKSKTTQLEESKGVV